jgi:aryl-alcohol dehydrogenase-like predicted oxidoreductase
MQHRLIGGDAGLRVSVVGLGCNNFGGRLDETASAAVIDAALDAGINFFDTADVYGVDGGAESALGAALAGRRASAVIATKFGYATPRPGSRRASPEAIRAAVESSLRRLRTDWIDLYQLHVFDPQTPWEDILRTLDDLVREGKIRQAGACNLDAAQVRAARQAADGLGVAGFATQQNEYSLLKQDAGRTLLPLLSQQRAGFIPYFPLAHGLLTGKYGPTGDAPADSRLAAAGRWRDHYLVPSRLQAVQRYEQFAAARGHSVLELAIGWLISQAGVSSVIAGATRTQQVRANAAASDWQLSGEELAAVAALGERLAQDQSAAGT